MIDQLASDRDARRNRRQVVLAIPVGVHDLVRIAHDVAAHPFGSETEHETVRERPGLTSEIPHVAHLDADLFTHFAHDRTFEGLTRFDESGQTRIHRRAELNTAREQCLLVGSGLTARHERDHRRRQSRKRHQPTGRTFHGPLVARELGRGPAPTTEAMRPGPVDELYRAPGHEPFVFRGPTEVTEQVEGGPFRRIVAARNVDTPPCVTVENSEEVHRPVVVSASIVDPDT